MAFLKERTLNLYNQGKHAKALPLAIKYAQLVGRQYGLRHSEYAYALSMIGRIHFSDGDYKKSEPHLKRALSINESIFGPNHPRVIKNLEDLAELYYALVMFKKADALLARAKKIAQK